MQLAATILPEVAKLSEVSEKFIRQLYQYWYDEAKKSQGHARLTEAAAYFAAELNAKFRTPIKNQLAEMLIKRAPKELIKFYSGLEKMGSEQITLMKECPAIWQALLNGAEPSALRAKFHTEEAPEKEAPAGKILPTSAFTATQKITLKMFREGGTIADIAGQRNMSLPTIEGHIALFVENGHIPMDDLIMPEKADLIRAALNGGKTGIHEVKKQLGDSFSYFEIRAVIAYLKLASGENAKPGTLF